MCFFQTRKKNLLASHHPPHSHSFWHLRGLHQPPHYVAPSDWEHTRGGGVWTFAQWALLLHKYLSKMVNCTFFIFLLLVVQTGIFHSSTSINLRTNIGWDVVGQVLHFWTTQFGFAHGATLEASAKTSLKTWPWVVSLFLFLVLVVVSSWH